MSLKAIRLTIFGKVQGVGYRFYTQRKAQELNLTGWVKNQRDGTVYVEVEGEKQAVDTFIDWCNEGPSSAPRLLPRLPSQDPHVPQERAQFLPQDGDPDGQGHGLHLSSGASLGAAGCRVHARGVEC